jgi:hypothetical protein
MSKVACRQSPAITSVCSTAFTFGTRAIHLPQDGFGRDEAGFERMTCADVSGCRNSSNLSWGRTCERCLSDLSVSLSHYLVVRGRGQRGARAAKRA